MNSSFRLSLRAGEKIYINGGVLRADRKVTLEILNDVTFLMESHVLQADEATTPLRQLYFAVQTMLMDPGAQEAATGLFKDFHDASRAAFKNPEVLGKLDEIGQLVDDGRQFDALRTIRRLFPIEDRILETEKPDLPATAPQQRRPRDGSYAA